MQQVDEKGVYGNTWESEVSDDGEFVRHQTSFRDQIRADGSTEFEPAGGRYHEGPVTVPVLWDKASNRIVNNEADVRLFTTLVRFDSVYVAHFKTNRQRIVDYPNIWGFTRDIYQLPGVAETVDMAHIKSHYFESHTHINPFGIVPDGPLLNFDEPHNRG